MSLVRQASLLGLLGLCAISSAQAAPKGALLGPPPEPIIRPFDVLEYDLSVNMNPTLAEIDGLNLITVEITEATSVLEFDLSGLTVNGVTVNGVDENFIQRNEVVTITTSGLLTAGEIHEVGIAYGGTPNTGNDRLGLNIMPPGSSAPNEEGVAWTITEPDGSRRWFPCNDTPADKAALRLSVTVPDGWAVASNGVLADIHRRKRLHGTEDMGLTFVWEEDHQIATYLTAMAAAPYLCFDGENIPSTKNCENFIGQSQDALGFVPLQFFARSNYAGTANEHWQVTGRQVETFSDIFVPYPFDKYGNVEAPMHYSGMEHQTMTLWSSNRLASDSVDSAARLSAHELAHHWFGDLVTPSNWNDIWLNEGWATYGEAIWAEENQRQKLGDAAAAQKLASHMKDVQDGYMAFHGSDNSTSLYAPEEMFGVTSYSKGATVVHMIRYILGDEAFRTMTREYLNNHAFGNATTFDLIDIAEDIHGSDLDWFFQPYVFTSDNPFPELDIGWESQGNRLDIGIAQRNRQPIFTLRLPVEITLDDGQTLTKELWVEDAPGTHFSLQFDQGISNIRVDPQNWWLAEKRMKQSIPGENCGQPTICDGLDDSTCVGATCEDDGGAGCNQSATPQDALQWGAALFLGMGLMARRRQQSVS